VPRATYVRPVVLVPPPGWEQAGVQDFDVIFLIDDSGSMYGFGGDNDAKRRACALSVVQLMAKGGGGRVGVVHWGSSAPEELVLPLTPVSARRRIEQALEIPPTLGGTRLCSGLERALGMIETPERHVLVLVITDGLECPAENHARLVACLPPGSVHLLILDIGGGCTVTLEAAWQHVGLGSFTRLPHADNAALALETAGVLARTAGCPPPERSGKT